LFKLKSKKNLQQLNVDVFANNSKADYQSINDLITRRNRLKSAIILSNATTKVKIGDTVLTVAEVIERKQSLKYYKTLFDKLKTNRETYESSGKM
jgi:molybdopterin synthase catalytic subunit